ncbi:MAG: hypothetical protein LBP32_04065, partial [Spirochaetaceae bacterium]|nr:hypothetical protein [Spirochaetaceae bacterium]
MEIRINGSRADITLESERSLGEVLSGIEKWLEASGHCLIGLAVDGRIVTASAIAGIFNLPLERIRTVDVTTGTWAALTLEALYAARVTLDDFAEAPFDEQNRIRNGWEAGAGANFLAEKIPGIHAAINRALRGDGLLPGDVRRLIDERIREIENPGDELDKAGPVVTGIVRRLEDLPLDIQ